MTWTSKTRLYTRTTGLNKGSGFPKETLASERPVFLLLLFKAGTAPPQEA